MIVYAGIGNSADFTRLFINLGSVDDFTRGDMLGFICNTAKISGKSIGKIDLKGVYTFFEVENAVADAVQQNFKGAEFNGRNVRIEVAGDRDSGSSRSGGGRGRREGGYGSRNGSGFRDFSGKRREDRSGSGERSGERKRRY